MKACRFSLEHGPDLSLLAVSELGKNGARKPATIGASL